MRIPLQLFLLFFLALYYEEIDGAVLQDGSLLVEGHAPPFGQQLFQEFVTSYHFVTSLVQLAYVPHEDPSEGLTEISDPNTTAVIWSSAEAPITEQEYQNELRQFPIFGTAIVVVYGGSLPAGLVLDLPTLARIYLGEITNWGDSDIDALNTVTLPNQPITVVFPTAPISCTRAFTYALSNASNTFSNTVGFGTHVNFPSGQYASSVGVSSVADMKDAVSTNGYSIGFLYLPIARATPPVPMASMINSYGKVIAPDDISSAVTSAMNDFVQAAKENTGFAVDIGNAPGNNSWPIAAYLYIVVRNNSLVGCEERRELLNVISWTQLNEAIQSRAATLGYVSLPRGIKRSMLILLSSIMCNNSPVYNKRVIIGTGLSSSNALAYMREYTLDESGGSLFLNYQILNDLSAYEFVTSMDVDFAIASSEYNEVPDAYNLPLTASGVGCSYHLSELPSDYSLILSMKVLADIYYNVVTMWNDSSIVDLNPEVSDILNAINQPIKPIYRFVPNPVTTNVVEAISKLTNYTSTMMWPVRTSPNAISGGDEFDILDLVINTNYSIAFIPFQFAKISTSFGIARLISRDGDDPVAISDTSIKRTMSVAFSQGLYDHETLAANLSGIAGEGTYPMSSFVYIILRTDAWESDCEKLSLFLDWFVWIQTYPLSDDLGEQFGYSSLSDDVNRAILLRLATMSCRGKKALRIANCLTNDGSICSGNGFCIDGSCQCATGYEGSVCDGTSDDDDIIAIATSISVGVPFLLLLCCLIICLIIAVIVIVKNNKDRSWDVDFSEITLKQQIGAGAYGAVHKAVWRDCDAAVKLISHSSEVTRELKQNFISEVKIMTQLRHPNVVLFMGACTKPPNLCIIMEYMELGSLYDVLHNELVPRLPDALKNKLALQAAQGMHFLHTSGILHRDLKSPNILLDDKWNAKISDFGLTQFKTDSNSNIDKFAGSLYWTAPEILGEEAPFSEPSDVYSFGIILWELASQKDPYDGMNPTTVAVGVLKEDLRPTMPNNIDPQMKSLIKNCWDRNPNDRPAFLEIINELLSLPFISFFTIYN